MADLNGKSFGRYRIIERLGEGGMATVYKAYDSMLEREVAVKIIRREAFPPEILQDVLKRFEREAKSLARLAHTNIVKVLDFGEYEGAPYLVLEYLAGGTLREKVGTAIPWQIALKLLLPIARGVEYAHRRGVVHRDIKPANILMTEGNEPTLSDFGIAKIIGGERTTNLTSSGIAIGTPEYMAPEQWTGETTIQSDIYALGVVLFELVTGRKPYEADTPGGILMKQMMEPLPLPREFAPDLPEPVEAILLKALAKDPQDRYADMQALIADMEEALVSDAVTQPIAITQAETEPPHPEALQDNRPKGTKLKFSRTLIFAGVGVLIIVAVIAVSPLFSKLFPVAPLLTSTATSTITPTSSFTATNPPPSATPEPSLTPTPSSTPTATPLLFEIIDAKNVTMHLVPAGEFSIGTDFYEDTAPRHQVYLDNYYMDIYEVTNAFYKACVEAGVCTNPEFKHSNTHPNYYGDSKYGNYPVIYVNWDQAQTYCEKWRGARLPTEAEWEKAARGASPDNGFPWSNTLSGGPNKGLANYNLYIGDTTEVGSYENGRSPYSLYDMAGNVWEWVADWYERYPGNTQSNSAYGTSYRVLRGGSWADFDIQSARRNRLSHNATSATLGFRCARNANP